jgi:serine O-acetyltransferase
LQAGPGLKLLHGVGIVINADAVLGTNVTIMQGVTIGGTQRGIPIIEDDVIVCANATVMGRVRLGRGAVVGAGAVVVKDVPEASNVVGNPAQVLERTAPPKGYYPLPGSMR